MQQPPDYVRRRVVVAAIGALLLIVAGRETPVIGSISITVDHGVAPHVEAAWSPPLALAITGVTQAAVLVDDYLLR